MLLSATREWPWGLVVLSDPVDSAPLPSSLADEAVVTTASTVVSRIQHGIDGEATATVAFDVAFDVASPALLRVHSGCLTVVSGRLRLGDAGDEQTQEAAVAAGDYRVQVFVDATDHPTQVVFVLDRLAQ